MKRINTIIESNTQPKGNNTLWIKPKEGGGKELKLGSESIIASSDTLLLDKLDSNEVVKLFQTNSTYSIKLPNYFTDYKIDIGSMCNTLKAIVIQLYGQAYYFKLSDENLKSGHLPFAKTFEHLVLSYQNPLSWTIRLIYITIKYDKANGNYMLNLTSYCLGNNT